MTPTYWWAWTTWTYSPNVYLLISFYIFVMSKWHYVTWQYSSTYCIFPHLQFSCVPSKISPSLSAALLGNLRDKANHSDKRGWLRFSRVRGGKRPRRDCPSRLISFHKFITGYYTDVNWIFSSYFFKHNNKDQYYCPPEF